jgi:hypothetical protein
MGLVVISTLASAVKAFNQIALHFLVTLVCLSPIICSVFSNTNKKLLMKSVIAAVTLQEHFVFLVVALVVMNRANVILDTRNPFHLKQTVFPVFVTSITFLSTQYQPFAQTFNGEVRILFSSKSRASNFAWIGVFDH